MIEDKTLYKVALEKFGAVHETDITIGEIGEFLTCIGRQAQGRITHEEWIDEIADVHICIGQMAYIHGWDEVKERIKEKMKKKLAHIQNAELKSNLCPKCGYGLMKFDNGPRQCVNADCKYVEKRGKK